MCHNKIWKIAFFFPPSSKRCREKSNDTFKLVVLRQKSSYITQYKNLKWEISSLVEFKIELVSRYHTSQSCEVHTNYKESFRTSA